MDKRDIIVISIILSLIELIGNVVTINSISESISQSSNLKAREWAFYAAFASGCKIFFLLVVTIPDCCGEACEDSTKLFINLCSFLLSFVLNLKEDYVVHDMPEIVEKVWFWETIATLAGLMGFIISCYACCCESTDEGHRKTRTHKGKMYNQV